MDKNACVFALALVLTCSVLLRARQHPSHGDGVQDGGAAWAELQGSMRKMHSEMSSSEPSGNNDVDFVALMLPHHQAAIEMAKTELLRGSDPQMRRLAQEIITDQQSEIDLMKRWLKQHRPVAQK